MSSYTHFTLDERKYLQQLLSEGYSIRRAAAVLERSPSSVSREIRRNWAKYKPKAPDNPYWYNHWHAQNLYTTRRREQVRAALKPGTERWDFIVRGLSQWWSPEQICGRWEKEHPKAKKLSITTIYRYIRQKKFPDITAKTHQRRRGKKYVRRDSNCNTIHPDRIIPEWPKEIKQRKRFGDWEGDTVLGGIGKGLLLTLVDRKSRYVRIGLLEHKTAEETRQEIERCLAGLPVESLSFDNGSEFAQFHELEAALKTLVYFAEPHKPWQRGTNENTNDLIRFFFPKGYDFRKVMEDDVARVEWLLNSRPRKCLKWKTPAEVFSVALA